MLFGFMGYLSALAGFLPGAALRLAFGAVPAGGGGKPARWLWAGTRAASAAALIAIVCFVMMPRVFDKGAVAGTAGLVCGVLAAALVNGKAWGNLSPALSGAAVFAAGIALHGLPEGAALGAAMRGSPAAGFAFALALAAHCFTEAFAISGYMRRGGFRRAAILGTACALAVPVGIGAAAGSAARAGNPGAVASACLAFSGGVMIYLACGELLPEKSARAV